MKRPQSTWQRLVHRSEVTFVWVVMLTMIGICLWAAMLGVLTVAHFFWLLFSPLFE